MATSTVDLNDLYTFANFLINKFLGGYYTPEQMDLLFDRSQMVVYDAYLKEFGKSQRLNDSMAPFKRTFVFSNSTSPGGLVTVPPDYYNLLSVIPTIFDSYLQVPKDVPCPVVNEDEIVAQENSQIIPLNTSNPFCVVGQNWNIQLYPKVPQAGTVFYLCRPATPKYQYTTTGRVITYNSGTSTQLQWADKDIDDIIFVAMDFLGINLREQDVMGWATNKDARLTFKAAA